MKIYQSPIIFLLLAFIFSLCNVKAPEYQGLRDNLIYAQKDTVLSDSIIYHPVRLDENGGILPWYSSNLGESYDDVIKRVWKFWINMEIDSNDVPYYMLHQVWHPSHDRRGLGGDQLQMALSSWDLLYNYTGDEPVLENMKYIANFYVAHSLSSPESEWPNLPYPYNTDIHSGKYDGDMILGKGFLQPDKAGSLGIELVKLYKKTSEEKYLDAAVKIANTLAEKVKPGDSDHSPWPFKVNAITGETGVLVNKRVWYEGMSDDVKNTSTQTKSSYTTFWTGTLELFTALIDLEKGDTDAYKNAFDITLNWLKSVPVKTNKWGPFFEDVPGWSDTQINAITYAMYLMDHPDLDPEWSTTVQNIFDWVHTELDDQRYNKYGVITTDEQTAYRQPGNSHSSRQASMELKYWKMTGDTTYIRNAVRMLNWATYMVDYDGKNYYPTNAVWMTDGYGDYVRHYLRAMAQAPQLAPQNADHLLRSSSVVQHISYSKSDISYRTFDPSSHEVFRLTSKPKEIHVNELRLKEVLDPSLEGWSWQTLKEGGVLQIYHTSGNTIKILK